MLFAQSIVNAESLSKKTVRLFSLCAERLSRQLHYDFGLRAMKSVLVRAGELKRARMHAQKQSTDYTLALEEVEESVLVTTLCQSILTKFFVASDVTIFKDLLGEAFPGASIPAVDDSALMHAVEEVCREEALEGCKDGQNQAWIRSSSYAVYWRCGMASFSWERLAPANPRPGMCFSRLLQS